MSLIDKLQLYVPDWLLTTWIAIGFTGMVIILVFLYAALSMRLEGEI